MVDLKSVTFNDDFNNFVSSPDGSVGWMTTYTFGGETSRTLPGNDEAEYYSDNSVGENPFTVSNGVLSIRASLAPPGSNPYGLPYDSGLITTNGSFNQLYGYFEVRAELPAGKGLWPAFWLLPESADYASELDVFEVLGDNPNTVYQTVHDYGGSDTAGQAFTASNTSTAFHTYGVDWEPDFITYYVDGQAVFKTITPASMKEPMYMLLNLAVGGNGSWPGAPDNAMAFPADFKIDYVRAEQTSNTIGWTDPMPTQPGPLVLPAIQEAARPGTAYAYVFVEHFGIEDAGMPIGGVGVALLNSSGKVIATGTTSQTGVYTFGGLAAGTYSIQYITPGSLYVRPGNFADAKSGITGSFTLSDGQGYGVPFQLVSSSAELAGDVQLGTHGIANVTVELLDAQKSVVKSTTTDGSGHFSFWTPAGSYYVRYTPSPGTALLSGSLADPTTGLTPVIVLSDQHDFLLVPEQFAASSATNSIIPPAISATPVTNNDQVTAATQIVPTAPATPVSVTPTPVSAPTPTSTTPTPNPGAAPLPDSPQPTYRFFDEINGTQFLTSSQSERDALLSNGSKFTYEGYGINSVTMDSSDRNVAPVFRFFSTSNGTHFFTTNVDERNTILATRPDLVQEQANFAEHLTPQAGDAAIYRFFDSRSGDHFFTQSAAEHASIISSRPDMIDEGIAFYAPSQL